MLNRRTACVVLFFPRFPHSRDYYFIKKLNLNISRELQPACFTLIVTVKGFMINCNIISLETDLKKAHQGFLLLLTAMEN